MLHHRIQHLGCRYHLLSSTVYLSDDRLLDDRNTLQRDLHAHIASGDHDAVRSLYNLINVVHPLLVLDLRNNIDVPAAILIQKQAHLADVFSSAGK